MRSLWPLMVSTFLLGLALADETKQPDAPECKGFLKTPRTRLAALWGSYAWKEADEITGLAFTQDGSSVVVVTPRSCTTYERASGKEGKGTSFPLGAPSVLSSDGQRLLFLGKDLVCVDVAQRSQLWKADAARAACFAQGGKHVLAISGGDLFLYDDKGKVRRKTTIDDGARLAALAPDGKHALVWDGKRLAIFDTLQPKPPRKLDCAAPPVAMAWEDDLLVTAHEDGKLRSWADGKLRWEVPQKNVSSLGIFNDKIVVAGDGVVTIRSSTGAEERSFEERSARSFALSPDGQFLAVAGRCVRLFNLGTGKPVVVPDSGHMGAVLSLAVSNDKLHVLSGGEDGVARLWNVPATREFQVLAGHKSPVTAVSFSKDGTQALTASGDGTILVWDMKKGVFDLVLEGAGPVGAASFELGGVVAAGTDGTLSGFELAKGKKVLPLGEAQPERAPVAIAGGFALIADKKGTVKMWDLAKQREARTLEGHFTLKALALAEKGRRALGGGEATLKVWDASSGSDEGQFALASPVSALAVSPDGKLGLVATEDGEVGLWDLETKKQVDTIKLSSSRDRAVSAIFAGDGFILGTARGVVLSFDLS